MSRRWSASLRKWCLRHFATMRTTISLYSHTTVARRVVGSWKLSNSVSHTIVIKVLGNKVRSATGTRVDVAAFLVLAP